MSRQKLFKDGEMKLSDPLARLILLHTMYSSFISPDVVSNLEASAERTLPYNIPVIMINSLL